MQEGEDLHAHINMVKALADQLRSIEVNIEDEDVYMVLFMSLPPSSDNLVTSLEFMSTKDVDLQFIVARLFHEVSKRKESESKENVALLNKTHKANEKLCFLLKTIGSEERLLIQNLEITQGCEECLERELQLSSILALYSLPCTTTLTNHMG
jgi:hypothetical protein